MDKLDSYHLPVTGRNILRFAFPTIVMTVFNTFYTMVDGLFVSNLIGMEALSAINLTAPAIALITAISGMLATGGSAVVMKKMGEHKEQEARQDFTLLILTNAVVGAVMMLLGYTLMDTLLGTMGLSPAVFGYCHTYLSNYLLFTIPILLMYNFSLYLIAADKSTLSLICTVAGGVTNIILDYALISLFDLGIQGAAIATGLGYSITAVVGFLVFRKKDSLLHFEKPVFRGGVLFHASTNGMSELATSLVSGITTLLFNLAMLKYVGEDGVAAYGVLMYVSLVFQAIFIGYSVGVAPVVGYHHGAGNRGELKGLLRRSVLLIGGFSAAMCLAGETLGRPLSVIFVGYDPELLDMTAHAFAIFSVAFLFSGFAIFGSSFFTALNDGLTSALISFLRTLVFQCAAVIIFPILWGLDGIWWSIVAAEVMAVAVTLAFLIGKRKKYGYA